MTRRADLTPAQISLLEESGEEIVDALRGIPLEVEGAPKASVKYKDGSFKMKPILAGWNFFPAYSYLGKRGEVIFGLTPEDTQEYEFVEFSHKAMDTVFPLAGGQLGEKLELTGENFKTLFDEVVIRRGEKAVAAEKLANQEYAENPNFGMF